MHITRSRFEAKLAKCECLNYQILFLGHMVDGHDIHTMDGKISAIKHFLKVQVHRKRMGLHWVVWLLHVVYRQILQIGISSNTSFREIIIFPRGLSSGKGFTRPKGRVNQSSCLHFFPFVKYIPILLPLVSIL